MRNKDHKFSQDESRQKQKTHEEMRGPKHDKSLFWPHFVRPKVIKTDNFPDT